MLQGVGSTTMTNIVAAGAARPAEFAAVSTGSCYLPVVSSIEVIVDTFAEVRCTTDSLSAMATCMLEAVVSNATMTQTSPTGALNLLTVPELEAAAL